MKICGKATELSWWMEPSGGPLSTQSTPMKVLSGNSLRAPFTMLPPRLSHRLSHYTYVYLYYYTHIHLCTCKPLYTCTPVLNHCCRHSGEGASLPQGGQTEEDRCGQRTHHSHGQYTVHRTPVQVYTCTGVHLYSVHMYTSSSSMRIPHHPHVQSD